MPEEEKKEVRVNIKFTTVKLLTYGAIAAAIIGLLWGILAAVGLEGAPGSYKFAAFLQGLFFAVLGGCVLYGLSEIVSRKQ